MLISFFITLIVYSLYAALPLTQYVKTGSVKHILLGLIFSIIGNLCWIYISIKSIDKSQILINGIIFDSFITITFIAVPVIFYGARVGGFNLIGISLVVAGILLIKIGHIL